MVCPFVSYTLTVLVATSSSKLDMIACEKCFQNVQ